MKLSCFICMISQGWPDDPDLLCGEPGFGGQRASATEELGLCHNQHAKPDSRVLRLAKPNHEQEHR